LGAYNDIEESVAYLVIYASHETHIFTLLQHHPQKPMCNQNIPRRYEIKKNKGILRQAEVALGVPGRLRPRILTFGTTRVVGHQPNALAAFTPGEILGTHFQSLSRPQGTWFCRKEPRQKSQVTSPGIDPGTVRLVAQHLNHYATSDPRYEITSKKQRFEAQQC
jgi:hypothetical protein